MPRLSRIALAVVMAVIALPTLASELKVMTFNVRTSVAKDGLNAWDKRRDLFADTIRQLLLLRLISSRYL